MHQERPHLEPCPFCGLPLKEDWRKYNPHARCVTEGCKGKQLPLLNLDLPDDIERWNTRGGLLLQALPVEQPPAGRQSAADPSNTEVAQLRAENATLRAALQQHLEQPPAAYMRPYLGSMDFIPHEPWCLDGLSPGWVPLYQRPAPAAGALVSCAAKQPSKDATDDR